MSDTTTGWMTAAEAARYLKVRPRTVLAWARQGKLKAYTLSGTRRITWRFRLCDLDTALLESSVLCSPQPAVLSIGRANETSTV